MCPDPNSPNFFSRCLGALKWTCAPNRNFRASFPRPWVPRMNCTSEHGFMRGTPSRENLQCWNAFGNLWATAPISRLSLQPPGELKPMLECALGTSRPPALISSLPCNCSGIKANVGMRCGNLVGTDSDIQTSLGTAWGNQGHATSLTSSPPQPPFRQMAHGYCPVSHWPQDKIIKTQTPLSAGPHTQGGNTDI